MRRLLPHPKRPIANATLVHESVVAAHDVERSVELSLRQPLDRLYDQEREERNERRGLEQRAATTVGAVLVGLGLIVNAVSSSDLDLSSSQGVLVLIGGLMSVGGLLFVTLALAGMHTNDDVSLRQAFAGGRRSRLEQEPFPLTDEYVETQRQQVERLRDTNAVMVRIVRIASAISGVGIHVALLGVAVELF